MKNNFNCSHITLYNILYYFIFFYFFPVLHLQLVKVRTDPSPPPEACPALEAAVGRLRLNATNGGVGRIDVFDPKKSPLLRWKYGAQGGPESTAFPALKT